ncbi:MAG: hypothetical protein IPH75_16060 [bacterium]|nr:hypothetical protein [bacterium]
MKSQKLLVRGVFLTVAFVIWPCVVFAYDPGGDVQTGRGSQSATTSVVKSSGAGASLWSDPKNSGIISKSVNLYTGQHVESFPLLSLPGRDGYGASLSLDYNGNVFAQAKQENYRAQASPFGLGFTLGGQSIVADHRGTVDISDDDYRLILDNTVVGLKEKDGVANSYLPESGDPWAITRVAATIDGVPCVIGWIIKREDGTIYRYGDGTATPASWNATRNILCYGTFVGNGITTDDKIYPTQWDLKVIHDPDSLHWVAFSYLRDLRYLTVGYSNGTIANSAHQYVSASYLSTVQSDDGRTLELSYSARQDADTVLGYNNYEIFFSKKCDMLVEKSAAGIVAQKLKLEYTYLNAGKMVNLGAPFEKLLLSSITRWTPDGSTASLPPVHIEYFLDEESASFGAIHKIYYPSGAIKEIGYDQVPAANNFARLDALLLSEVQAPAPAWYSDGICITHPSGSNQWKIAIWDGYWHILTISGSSEVKDRPGILPGQVVIIPGDNNELITLRWRGGYWEQDTIENAYTRGGYQVFIYPGQDCFLMVLGTWSRETGTRHRLSKYFQWDYGSWHSNDFADTYGTNYLMCGVRMRNSMVILSLFDLSTHYIDNEPSQEGHYTYLYWGKYVNSTSFVDGNFAYETAEVNTAYEYDIRGNIFIGHDYIGCMGSRYLYANKWNGMSWSSFLPIGGDSPWRSRTLSEQTNGVVWNYVRDDGKRSHLDALVPSTAATGFSTHWQWAGNDPDDDGEAMTGLWTNGAGLAYCLSSTGIVAMYRWTGSRFTYIFDIASTGWDMTKATLTLGDFAYTFGPTAGKGTYDTVITRHFIGGSKGWLDSKTGTNINNGRWGQDGVASSSKAFLRHGGDAVYAHIYDLFRFGEQNATRLLLNKDPMKHSLKVNYSVDEQGFFIAPRQWSDTTDGPWDYTNAVDNVEVHRLCDTLFSGDAPFLAVSSVTTRQYVNDPEPIITTYAYDGGLLDRSVTTPRFAKVKESTPHLMSTSLDSIGYAVHMFYNDIDTSGFYDNSIYNGRSFPDLKSADRYGIDNGAFRLDGTEYLTYSYVGATEPTSGKLDSVHSYHSLYAPAGYPSDVYRVRLDRVDTYKDSLFSRVRYEYDLLSNQVIRTKTQYVDTNSYILDEVVPAYTLAEYPAMINDNALVQIAEQTRTLHHGEDTLLAKSRTDFIKNGSWRPSKNYTYRTVLPTPTDIVYTDSLLPDNQSFDIRGNVVAACGPNGVITSSKYDAPGNRPVAAAVGCKPGQFLYQDFEQPASWDSWSIATGDYHQLVTDAHTGGMAFKLIDNPATWEKNWGPSRIIQRDMLQDSVYYFSGWVKTNHEVIVFCWCLDDATPPGTCSGGYKSLQFSQSQVGSGEWTRVEGSFDIREQMRTSNTCFNKLRFQLVLADDGSASTGDYAIFDDFRFHPAQTAVSSTVYDEQTGIIVSTANGSNFPVTTTYDELHRQAATFNSYGDSLSRVDYTPSLSSASRIAEASNVELDSQVVIIEYAQAIAYTLRTEANAKARQSKSKVYRNNDLMVEIECPGYDDECSETATGTFEVAKWDTVRIVARSSHVGADAYARVNFNTPEGYDPASPAQVKTTAYSYRANPSGTDQQKVRSVAISYFDAYGRTLQNRVMDSVRGMERAIVAGLKTYDGRGRVLKSYLPYVDTVGQTGVAAFSPWSTAITEVNAYYDGDSTRGPDCEGYPYAEVAYSRDADSKVVRSGASGPDLRLGSAHQSTATSGSEDSDPSGPYSISETIDPDGLRTIAHADQWGRWSKQITPYRIGEDTWNVTLKTVSKLTQRLDSVLVDTSRATTTSEIPLRWSAKNALGQDTATWKVDYGTIRMLYDRAGNLRFMQNQRRRDSLQTVYFKYDPLGRKIEEGIADSLYFTQAHADDPTQPATPIRITYKWTYDYYQSGNTTLLAPGKLVRIQNSDSSYYKNFTYSSNGEWDQAVVKLPQAGTAKRKVIQHYFSRDGKLAKLVVYPDSANAVTARVFTYQYDQVGRIASIKRGVLSGEPLDTLAYATYYYNPDGSHKRTLLGKYDLFVEEPLIPRHDTVQQLDYRYKPEGRLDFLNKLGDVSIVRNGTADHVATAFEYHPESDPIKYYNGRVRRSTTANSIDGAIRTHDWYYEYNDLGWLIKADNTSFGSTFDQQFTYNALGHRTQMVSGSGAVTNYTYGTSTPGSSKLISMTGSSQPRTYDMLGNLISDPSRGVLSMTYDYRNLLIASTATPATPGGSNVALGFGYDETGLRIKKASSYTYYVQCDDDTGIVIEGMVMGGDSGLVMSEQSIVGGELDSGVVANGSVPPGQCPRTSLTETYYLYDGGLLLATFDKNDNVVDLFVNGPSGRIANYVQNSSNQLYYFLSDQVGSTRILMRGVPPQTAGNEYYLAEYYNYYPFGEMLESWGNQPSAYQFSGKEHDLHGGFDYVYFGARYYDAELGQFASIDKASQFASGYVYGGNNPIMGVDQDGNWFFAAAFWALRAYSTVKGVEAGFKEGGVTGALRNLVVGGVTSAVAGTFGAQLGSVTKIGGMAASSTIQGAGNSIMYGTDVTASFGIGSFNLTKGGGWKWADLQGDFISDLGTVNGWGAAASDYSKAMSYVHLSREDRQRLSGIKDKYGATKGFDQDYPKDASINAGDTKTYGGIRISNDDYKTLSEIGDRYQNHMSIFDPLSWSGIRQVRNYVFGNVGPIKVFGATIIPSEHVSGFRFPNDFAVTIDTDGAYRVHGCINAMSVIGMIGHNAENFLAPQEKVAAMTLYGIGGLYNNGAFIGVF